MLRLRAGSAEAGFLADIVPLPKTPTIVMIKDGNIEEYISAGLPKADFVDRLSAAFSTASQLLSSHPALEDTSGNKIVEEDDKETSTARVDTRHPTQLSPYAEQLKRRRQEDAEERRRILKLIENDRLRRQRQALERQRARASSVGSNDSHLARQPQNSTGDTASNETASVPATTALQVRLLDGSVIRSHFPSDGTICRHVRPWVDRERADGTSPDAFKVVLTPRPGRDIHNIEESITLADLGLSPSSTLMLVEVPSARPRLGIFSMLLAYMITIFSQVTAALARGLGFGSALKIKLDDAPRDRNSNSPGRSLGSSTQVDSRRPPSHLGGQRRFVLRRLHDLKPDEHQQLYNGNSVGLEPLSRKSSRESRIANNLNDQLTFESRPDPYSSPPDPKDDGMIVTE